MNRKNARLQEVAAHAGVSFITAWRALNAPDLVADKTAEKVRAAADEIGYVVNSVARSLVSAKSGIVGVIVPTLDDSIFADTVQGVSDALTASGAEILVGLSSYSESHEEEIVRAFLGRQVDGLILTGRTHTNAARKLLKRSAVPIVEIWDIPADPIDMSVGFSNYHLAFDATRFLAQKGYERIAFVTPAGRSRGVEREKGYRACLQEEGLFHASALSVRAEPTLAGGAEALKTLLAMEEPPDAIFFNGDTLAIGGLLAAQDQGIAVPGQVAILGVHDLEISGRIRPSLSTVRVPRYRIGKCAADALLRRYESAGHSVNDDLGFEIVERETA